MSDNLFKEIHIGDTRADHLLVDNEVDLKFRLEQIFWPEEKLRLLASHLFNGWKVVKHEYHLLHLLDGLLVALHARSQGVSKGGGVEAVHQEDKGQTHLAQMNL